MIGRIRALFGKPPAMTPDQARRAVGAGAVLLDVRDDREWQAGHAPNAQHIPLGQLETRLGEIPTDQPVVTVCRSGRRSAIAADLLGRHGHQAFNLTGGMTAWAAEGLPVATARHKSGHII